MDKIYWADKIAKEVKERISKDPEVKSIVKKHGVLVYDEKTPSGEIHIGSGRGFIIHDIITKVLKDLGLKPRFELSSDDMDPMDKPIRELPEYNQYLGVPFRNIPSPVKGYKSYAEYYFKQATDKFKDYGIDVKLETTGGNYDKGIFNDAIKKILDNHDKVKAIFERTYDKPYEKISFNPICEKCGKIGTTVSYAWDKKEKL
jgi:lysyl-tRNA synthetase class 1